jgi:hypothetical protein
MPDSKKVKGQAQSEETVQVSVEGASQGEEGEKGAASETPTSPPGRATLSKARLEGLRRRLKAKYQ